MIEWASTSSPSTTPATARFTGLPRYPSRMGATAYSLKSRRLDRSDHTCPTCHLKFLHARPAHGPVARSDDLPPMGDVRNTPICRVDCHDDTTSSTEMIRSTFHDPYSI